MKKKIIIFILIAIFIIVSTSLLITINLNKKDKEITKDSPVVKEPTKDKITTMLENMTLEEKIGQMLFISYRKNLMDDTLNNLLTNIKPGGFIFFSENLQEYNEAQKLINDIKSTANIPLFLGIDEEGGRVDRFKNIKGYTYDKIPPMLNIGATNKVLNAYETGCNIAKILNDFNLNMNFAPVIDVYSNPNNTVIGNRSFGSDPKLVSNMGINLAQGLKDNNIIPVYKHFPGHGNTSKDSHYDLPIISKSKEYLLNNDLIPFIDAINNDAEVIMIGHLAVPSITENNTPASLSKELINDFLKNELNYQNIIITDALNMQAITKNYSNKEVYELAINAGVDILLMPNDQENAISTIIELINENKITEEQINSSVYKILKLKDKYLKLQ